jgi:hypothetical protein
MNSSWKDKPNNQGEAANHSQMFHSSARHGNCRDTAQHSGGSSPSKLRPLGNPIGSGTPDSSGRLASQLLHGLQTSVYWGGTSGSTAGEPYPVRGVFGKLFSYKLATHTMEDLGLREAYHLRKPEPVGVQSGIVREPGEIWPPEKTPAAWPTLRNKENANDNQYELRNRVPAAFSLLLILTSYIYE